MEIVPVNYRYMPLIQRDENLLQINQQIEAKRQLLMKKQKKLHFISKQNHFLDEVRKDYAKYYGYIVKQKQDQISSLEMLNEYIKDLSVSGSLSKHNIEDAKQEQQKILSEMKSIQSNLDSIIKNTSDVSSTLREKTV